MDYLSIKSAILANASCMPLAVTNDMPKQNAYAKDQAIADILNADPSFNLQLVSQPIKRGDFLRKHGPVTGSSLYTRIKSVSASYEPLQYVVAELEGDGLSITDISTLEQFIVMLNGLQGWQAGDMALIELVFLEKRMLTAADVSIALRNY